MGAPAVIVWAGRLSAELHSPLTRAAARPTRAVVAQSASKPKKRSPVGSLAHTGAIGSHCAAVEASSSPMGGQV